LPFIVKIIFFTFYSNPFSFLKCSHTGSSLQMITLDFRSDNVSTAHLNDAPTITLIVSWNDAADNQESASFAILVNPRANLFHSAGIFHCSSNSLLIFTKSSYFTYVHGINPASPGFSINTFENNCFTTTSICLSFSPCHWSEYTFFTSLIIYFCAWISHTISL